MLTTINSGTLKSRVREIRMHGSVRVLPFASREGGR